MMTKVSDANDKDHTAKDMGLLFFGRKCMMLFSQSFGSVALRRSLPKMEIDII